MEESENETSTENRHISVKVPSDPEVKKAIDKLAIYVAEDGHLFEQELLRRDIEKIPVLGFLRHKFSDEAHYYRWKVFSLLTNNASNKETKIFKNGAIWEPTEDSKKYFLIKITVKEN